MLLRTFVYLHACTAMQYVDNSTIPHYYVVSSPDRFSSPHWKIKYGLETVSVLWKTYAVGTICTSIFTSVDSIESAIISSTFGSVDLLATTAMFTFAFRLELFHLQLAPCLFHILIWLVLLTVYYNNSREPPSIEEHC